MGFCDITEAEVIAYTRQRRAEDKARKVADLVTKYGPTIHRRNRQDAPGEPYGGARYHAWAERQARGEVTPADQGHKARKVARKIERRKRTVLIAEAQRGRCYLCGRHMEEPTSDHVVPRARGGRTHKNILMVCGPDNVKKADRMPFACEVLFLRAINLIVA